MRQQKPPKDCPRMVHRPPSVSLGTSARRTTSASRTMLSALQRSHSRCRSRRASLPESNFRCTSIRGQEHATMPTACVCRHVMNVLGALRQCSGSMSPTQAGCSGDRPEVRQVLCLLLGGAPPHERGRGDGRRQPGAPLVHQQHAEVVDRRLDPGGRLRRARALVPWAACASVALRTRTDLRTTSTEQQRAGWSFTLCEAAPYHQ